MLEAPGKCWDEVKGSRRFVFELGDKHWLFSPWILASTAQTFSVWGGSSSIPGLLRGLVFNVLNLVENRSHFPWAVRLVRCIDVQMFVEPGSAGVSPRGCQVCSSRSCWRWLGGALLWIVAAVLTREVKLIFSLLVYSSGFGISNSSIIRKVGTCFLLCCVLGGFERVYQ